MRTSISYFSGVVEAQACPQQQVLKKITSKKGGFFFPKFAKTCKNMQKNKKQKTSSASPLVYNVQAACQYQLIPGRQHSLHPLPFVSQETHG